MVFIFLALLNPAHAVHCHFGTDLKIGAQVFSQCQVTGHSEGAGKTYSALCAGRQVEFQSLTDMAHVVDPITRKTTATCGIEKDQVAGMIRDYEKGMHDLESPKCYLSRWKGQMTFVTGIAHGRCSFKMNKLKSDEFKAKTGVAALYQCEGDYFLTPPDSSGTAIYRPLKGGWEMTCEASTRVGDPVEAIDWKNPPGYFEPEP
jgi:hypothetical protein